MKNQTVIASFVVGFLFAVGLNISGMTQPQKVIGFLDLFGQWDPSLIFVMAGAILVHASYIFLIKPKFAKPVFATEFQIPTKKNLTGSLFLGAVLFGIGWGLGGFCPGPALTSLATFSIKPLVFVVSMLVGMAFYRAIESKLPISK
jgi:uncharacterized membrane protein YedE/YeeE